MASIESDRSLNEPVRVVCGIMLLVALSCNIAVLFIPFLELRQVLNVEPYTVFHTVDMLWSKGLVALSFLVVGFSIIFPFFKLAVLFSVVLPEIPSRLRLRLLLRVEALAKWSMLDVFLVCLVLTLTAGQVLVGARPREGVALFIAAIVISMIVGQILVERSSAERHRSFLAPRLARLGSRLVPRMRIGLVVFSGLALAGALLIPFLKIEAWFLDDAKYSVVSVLPSLWKQGSVIGAIAVAVFLIVAPVVRWYWLASSVWRTRGRVCVVADRPTILLARYWSMLDVFALALAVFLLEGGSLVPTDAEFGAYLLVGFVFVIILVERLIEGETVIEEAGSAVSGAVNHVG